MSKRRKAEELNARANRHREKDEPDEAAALYRRAAEADPLWSVPLYNLGLLFKTKHDWEQSLEYNRRAVALDHQNQAAWWNLGIAATALARWPEARRAWHGFGIQVPDGTGPIELPCGFGPIRLNPKGDAEVVWAERIDPARAVLASIPFPESRHCWKDVVLNDGAPNGYRRYQGKEIPVFDELELLEPSVYGTYVARVALPERGLTASLAETAARSGGSAEDWSTSIRFICKACSEGRPHKDHDTAAAAPDGVHLIGIAARDRRHATVILSEWESGTPAARVESLEDGLPGGAHRLTE
jgi:hypothetical protein